MWCICFFSVFMARATKPITQICKRPAGQRCWPHRHTSCTVCEREDDQTLVAAGDCGTATAMVALKERSASRCVTDVQPCLPLLFPAHMRSCGVHHMLHVAWVFCFDHAIQPLRGSPSPPLPPWCCGVHNREHVADLPTRCGPGCVKRADGHALGGVHDERPLPPSRRQVLPRKRPASLLF